MSTYSTGHNNSGYSQSTGSNVRHSKEDALTEREFELLLEGASSLKDYYGNQATFLILLLGRLGMRKGEVAHMKRHWIDFENKMIRIPYHEKCHKARDSDSLCGYCKQLAKQKAKVETENHIDEVYDSHLEIHEPGHHINPEKYTYPEDRYEEMWTAKTEAASRDVYYGWNARIELYINRFFEQYDEWCWSAGAINRRVTKAAEKARELDASNVFPHALRATAATFHVGADLGGENLTQMFGWVDMRTGNRYVARSAKHTARQLDAIHRG